MHSRQAEEKARVYFDLLATDTVRRLDTARTFTQPSQAFEHGNYGMFGTERQTTGDIFSADS